VVLSNVPGATQERLGGLELGREPLEAALVVELPELRVAADRLAVDYDLWHRPAAGLLQQPTSEIGMTVEPDLFVVEAPRLQERLRPHTEAAPGGRVHLDPRHPLLDTQWARTGNGISPI
jgi:hypothetical protein